MKGLCGTAEYCAPEVAIGYGIYNEKCDMWSIGILIFLLVTLEFPFTGENESVILNKIV